MSTGLPGLLARFDTPQTLLGAVQAARSQGHRGLRAWTPYPVEGLAEALALPPSRLQLAMLLGGFAGGLGTLALQYYSAVIDYPVNIGGRPLASWPAFGPPALEMTLLCAGLVGILGLLLRSGLPRWHRPEFDWAGMEQASSDAFLLWLPLDDEDGEALRDWLLSNGARDLSRVGGDS